jgi:hypothetical protein
MKRCCFLEWDKKSHSLKNCGKKASPYRADYFDPYSEIVYLCKKHAEYHLFYQGRKTNETA